jgi:hypothetical protein
MDPDTDDFAFDTMDRPAKRPRLSITPESNSVEDVPEEWDLQAARAQNDKKLKSIFEGIFAKYGKDFTEVGDEIDLQTGKIVVDNGHLLGLREELDPRNEGQSWLYENEDAGSDHGGDLKDETVVSHEPPISSHEDNDIEEEADSDNNNSLLDSALAYNAAGNTESSKQATGKQIEDPGPKDPLWQAPDLPRILSTPTAESRAKVANLQPPTIIRESSPPGSGSLWTVPRRGRPPGRPRTEGKPKASPSKFRARAKPTYHSSPVAHDWSFSQVPDGDESDDPLQEYQPSPTPTRVTSIRGKRIKGPNFALNRYTGISKQKIVPRVQSATPTGSDDEADDDTSGQDAHSTRHVANGTLQQCRSPAQPRSGSKPYSFTVPRYKVPRKSYGSITPDEGRMIIRLRHVENMGFKEINDLLPNLKKTQICSWDHHHFTEVRLDPPHLSAPWTKDDMDTLEKLKNADGLSWAGIKAAFPGRTRKEIEYELIRLWVGEEGWNDGVDEQGEQGEEGEGVPVQPSKKRKRALDTETHEVDPECDGDTISGFKMPREDDSDSASDFEDNSDSGSDSDSDSDFLKGEAFSLSKLAAIDFEPAHGQSYRTPSKASPSPVRLSRVVV